jgi:hypothetical protein
MLTACGGGNQGSPYAGNWYDSNADAYYEINSDGLVNLRRCSMYDGYRITEQGSIADNVFTIEPFDYELIRTGSTLTMTILLNDTKGNEVTLSLKSSIADYCYSDAIEIISFSPAAATEGEPTLFTVNFDYRLTSDSTGNVWFLYEFGGSKGADFSDSIFEITKPGTSSGSLTATFTPLAVVSPDISGIKIILLEGTKSVNQNVWRIYSEDFKKVNITSGVN